MSATIRSSLAGLAGAALIAAGGLVTPTSPANAAVYCAAGVYHAGCVRRPAGAVIVAPAARCHWVVVNGVRVHRCY